ncbi:MAG: sigma-70 family RNA polymerase sigma factor [Firmicutes bacterium]|nr:sigma-70 family RNA polymerase sigma factor [Bacillota bacterium]
MEKSVPNRSQAKGAEEEQLLASLLQANYLKVLDYFLKLTQDLDLAKDLTQETMVKAIKNFPQYRGDAQFASWLISIGTNLYRDTLRKQKLSRRRDPAVLTGPKQPGPSVAKIDLKQALLQLPAEKRVPLILKYYYDYSYQEIATCLRIPVGTVRSRLHSAVHSLRRIMEAKLPSGEGE